MRDWTPYKSETITNIDLLDPVYEIAGQKYRRSEIIDIHKFWQDICDKQDVMMSMGKVIKRVDTQSNTHPIACFYAENCCRLNDKWYAKLREEWRPKQERLLANNHATLVDFIAKDLKEEYKAFRQDNPDYSYDDEEDNDDDY